MQVFPSTGSLVRLAGAVMCEQDETWQESRYFSEAKMRELYDEGRTRGLDGTVDWSRLEAEARKMIESGLKLADRIGGGIGYQPYSRFLDAGPTRFGSGRYTNFLDTTGHPGWRNHRLAPLCGRIAPQSSSGSGSDFGPIIHQPNPPLCSLKRGPGQPARATQTFIPF